MFGINYSNLVITLISVGWIADSSTDYSLRKATKYLKRPKIQVPAFRKDDNIWVLQCVTFAEHLESRFQINPGMEDLPDLRTNDYDDKIPLVTTPEIAEEKGAWVRYIYSHNIEKVTKKRFSEINCTDQHIDSSQTRSWLLENIRDNKNI